MKKGEKIYLWASLALLVLFAVFIIPIRRLVWIWFSDDYSVIMGLLFGIIAAVYINLYFGVKGGIERIFATILGLSLTYIVVGGVFYFIEWAVDHIKIIP